MKISMCIKKILKSYNFITLTCLLFLVSTLSSCSISEKIIFQNAQNQSFSQAKRILEEEIYINPHERVTLYCEAAFDENMNITLPDGIVIEKYKNRMNKVEWEHIVPVENFGRTFPEWRDGHPLCVNSEGEKYKGRRCVEKVSKEFRVMQADMHNIYPAIGSVNASRSNYNFALLPNAESDFGTCQMKIENKKVEPPEYARGIIARAYLYMEKTYPRFKMSNHQRQLMNAWDKMYPPSDWEIERMRRVENTNKITRHEIFKFQYLSNK